MCVSAFPLLARRFKKLSISIPGTRQAALLDLSSQLSALVTKVTKWIRLLQLCIQPQNGKRSSYGKYSSKNVQIELDSHFQTWLKLWKTNTFNTITESEFKQYKTKYITKVFLCFIHELQTIVNSRGYCAHVNRGRKHALKFKCLHLA